MPNTGTRTATQTGTYTQVVYVTRKVQADFLAILDTYGYFSEKYAQDVIHDVRVFLDEEVVDRVKFVWTEDGTNRVLEELDYTVVAGGFGLADDRSGGIRYRSGLADAGFHVRVTYNSRWREMGEQERSAIRGDLALAWSAAGGLDYSGGSWTSERTYSKGSYGMSRSRFSR